MAKLPNKIKIGNMSITVERVKELKAPGGNDAYGRWMADEHRILIAPHPSLAIEQDTVLHEVLHGLFTHFWLPRKNEEHIVACLASGLMMVMNDNPRLKRYLFDRS